MKSETVPFTDVVNVFKFYAHYNIHFVIILEIYELIKGRETDKRLETQKFYITWNCEDIKLYIDLVFKP